MLGLSVCESQTQLILRKSDLFLESTIEKMKWQHDALEQVGVGLGQLPWCWSHNKQELDRSTKLTPLSFTVSILYVCNKRGARNSVVCIWESFLFLEVDGPISWYLFIVGVVACFMCAHSYL